MIERKSEIYLGLGTNLGEKIQNLERALVYLENRGVSIVAISKVYETAPMGFISNDKFYNVVVLVKYSGRPEDLLQICLSIEVEMGRIRKTSGYASRVIDIDLLMFNDVKMDAPSLILPHPHIEARLFVLLPLLDVLINESKKLFFAQVKSKFRNLDGIKCEGDLLKIERTS